MAALRAVVQRIDRIENGPSNNQYTWWIDIILFAPANGATLNTTISVVLLLTDTPSEATTKIIDAAVAYVVSRGHTLARNAILLPTWERGS